MCGTISHMENNTTQTKVSTPVAIVIAGLLVMVGILLTNGGGKNTKDKTLSEQVGVSKDKLSQCINNIDSNALSSKIQTSVENAMKGVPADQRGTPYTVVIGDNGIKTEIRGALSYESVKQLIDDVAAGKAKSDYTGEISLSEEGDHINGNPNAKIHLIEYSDYECPYCKMFQPTLEKIVAESNGTISWTYRHWPIHSGSFEKLVAAECVAQIKGNDAFWKYSDLLFSLIQTGTAPSFSDQL